MKITTYVTSFLAVLALASFSAAAAPSLELTTTVQQQKTTVDAKGAKHTVIGPINVPCRATSSSTPSPTAIPVSNLPATWSSMTRFRSTRFTSAIPRKARG